MLPKVENLWEWLGFDKIAHFILYGVFTFLLAYGFVKYHQQEKLNFKKGLLILVVGIVFGSLTEILQTFLFVNRSGNIYDFIANLIGCSIGLIIFLVINKKS